MKNIVKYRNQALLIASLIPGVCAAQTIRAKEDSTQIHYIGEVDLGKGTVGLYGSTSFALRKRNNFLKLKLSADSEASFYGPPPHTDYYTYELMVGRRIPIDKKQSFTLATGISRAEIHHDGDVTGRTDDGFFSLPIYQDVKVNTTGLPIEIRYNFIPKPFLGLTLGYGANINSVKNSNSVSIGVIFGNLL
jgi:hypothetical protein